MVLEGTGLQCPRTSIQGSSETTGTREKPDYRQVLTAKPNVCLSSVPPVSLQILEKAKRSVAIR